MVTPAQWAAYKNTVNGAAASFNQETITWHRLTKHIQRYGEDDPANTVRTDIDLDCLIQFNIFRTWPMSDETPSGLLDQESITVMLNREYLNGLGYLNSDGFFAMDMGNDLFTHMGVLYKPAGETPVSQAGDEPLHFYIILKREETKTGDGKY